MGGIKMKKLIITGIVTAGVLLGGTSLVGASMNDSKEVIVKEDVKSADTATKSILPVEKIKGIALSEYEGHIDDIELERENGYAYYEVEIENGHEDFDIYIDAYTGEVLTIEIDGDDDQERRQALENIISADEAKKIAVEAVSGKVVEFELDEDDNRYEYEMELRTDYGEAEVTIDAVTGEILKQELDD